MSKQQQHGGPVERDSHCGVGYALSTGMLAPPYAPHHQALPVASVKPSVALGLFCLWICSSQSPSAGITGAQLTSIFSLFICPNFGTQSQGKVFSKGSQNSSAQTSQLLRYQHKRTWNLFFFFPPQLFLCRIFFLSLHISGRAFLHRNTRIPRFLCNDTLRCNTALIPPACLLCLQLE